MKYQMIGWITLASITVFAAPYLYAICDLLQWQ